MASTASRQPRRREEAGLVTYKLLVTSAFRVGSSDVTAPHYVNRQVEVRDCEDVLSATLGQSLGGDDAFHVGHA